MTGAGAGHPLLSCGQVKSWVAAPSMAVTLSSTTVTLSLMAMTLSSNTAAFVRHDEGGIAFAPIFINRLSLCTMITRFAPSPTGYLHLGHAFSAFNAWKRARSEHGRFLLRLEDLDTERCRPEYAAAIQADLAWLGLDWDGPPRVQSNHLADYRQVLDDLSARELVYSCFCPRAG